ncbi:hypothetical protein ACFPVX_17380 [Cohnella faecalis]|uniref:Uncharacterized protein n=1 Tax=Cohnella faecalis TaxID=2315694 RepID=A0A398CEB7_9BACL|nr:hypothetical protein [Cohnella faecalis]RIE01516.1 hypothetical protein D3H35_24495 [Cohnella faecalis]
MVPFKKINSAKVNAEQPLVNAGSSLSLVRPLQDFLKDDKYVSEINEATVVEINGKLLLKLVVTVTDKDDYEQTETFLLKPDYRHPSSSYFKLLEVTGCMPGRGESLDVDSLVGQEVILSLKTVTKNGNVYTNIDNVEAVPDEEAVTEEADGSETVESEE